MNYKEYLAYITLQNLPIPSQPARGAIPASSLNYPEGYGRCRDLMRSRDANGDKCPNRPQFARDLHQIL